MDLHKVRDKVQGIPHMTFAQAEVICAVLRENDFRDVLELGFKHGVSTCYLAAALDGMGGGSITTIDLNKAIDFTPNVDQLLSDLGLSHLVTVYYEPTSYIWRLMKELEKDPNPRFDFCFIDGAHDWATDGFAFFLVDRLLKPGGMVIFDDMDWTYASSPASLKSDKVKSLPDEEKMTPQVKKIYDLLVKTHPGYGDFMVRDGWGYARKLSGQTYGGIVEVRKEVVVETHHVGVGSALLTLAQKASRRLQSRRIQT